MTLRATPETALPRGVWATEFADRLPLLVGIDANPLAPSPEFLAAMEAFGAPMGAPEATDVDAADFFVTGPHGPVRVRRYRSGTASNSRAALLWIHGGGFVSGDLEMPEADAVARGAASRTGALVFSIDYRLCVGGVTHPVPHDDCWAVYTWCIDNAEQLGIDPARIVIGGASAGGNLAASVALRGRDDMRPPARALLVYPVLHAPLPEPSAELARCLEKTPDVLRFRPEVVAALNANYLGGSAANDPLAFPGACTDLTGFPSTYIEACEFDELRSSASTFAEQLSSAGVDVEYVVAAGVPHGHLNTIGSAASRATINRIAAQVAEVGARS